MNQFWKKTLFGVGVLGSLCMVGCQTETSTKEDYFICNQTSNGDMAEIENGYFLTENEILYYADKSNLEQWIPVCNKPDCIHKDDTCNAYNSSNTIWQKDGKLYQMSGGSHIENPYIFEITTDGSGRKKVYEIPIEDEFKLSSSSRTSMVEFRDEFFFGYGYLNEMGIYQNNIICLQEDKNDGVKISTIYSGMENAVIMSGNHYWSIRGDNLLINSLFTSEGGMLVDSLCRINDNDELEPFILPEDITFARGHLKDDVFTYYNQKEGFYQYNLDTKEKELLFSYQLEDGRGYILSENCMVESNRYINYKPEQAQLKVYLGEEWIDVEVPKEVANNNNPFYPLCIASDRIFFQMNYIGEDHSLTAFLYYLMLDGENQELVFAGKIGNGVLEEPNTEETIKETEEHTDVYTNFEEVIVFETEDYLFKITDVYVSASNYFYVKMYFENRTSDTTYDIRGKQWVINGIQCNTAWGDDVSANDSKEFLICFREGGGRALGECKISDFYTIYEYTDIEAKFYLHTEDNIWGEPVDEASVRFYPQGEENAIRFSREPQSTDFILVNNENVSVIVTGYEDGFVPNDTIRVLIENKSTHTIKVIGTEAFANGIFIDTSRGAEAYDINVSPGAIAAYPMTLFDRAADESYHTEPKDDFFVENNITSIEEIKMKLIIYPCGCDCLEAIGDDFVNKTFVLTP